MLAPPPPLPADAALFLDFDGTLVALAATPDGIVVDAALPRLLARLATRLGGRVALVSGRSIAQLDGFLGAATTQLAVAGSHGAEQRLAHGVAQAPVRPTALCAAAAAIRDTFADTPGIVIEDKALGVALHYRQAPAHEDAAFALAEALAATHALTLQRGKMMIELRAPGDKGLAIERLMADAPFAGHAPIFLGDDVTDEDGFAMAAQLGGHGILVGQPRDSAARYRLDDVADVLAWLAAA